MNEAEEIAENIYRGPAFDGCVVNLDYYRVVRDVFLTDESTQMIENVAEAVQALREAAP